MTPQYYKSVLDQDWPGIEKYIAFFKERCDSQLEVLFGLSLVTQYQMAGYNEQGHYDWTEIQSDSILMYSPHACSPCGNGDSIAYLKPQVQHSGMMWDFGFFTANDNGARFEDCHLDCLVEIDGWGIHRTQRQWDESKGKSTDVRVIRVLEERFIDVYEMADAVLASTVWSMGGGMAEGDWPEKLQIFHPKPWLS